MTTEFERMREALENALPLIENQIQPDSHDEHTAVAGMIRAALRSIQPASSGAGGVRNDCFLCDGTGRLRRWGGDQTCHACSPNLPPIGPATPSPPGCPIPGETGTDACPAGAEPRGCPMPGACSCPIPGAGVGAVAEAEQVLRNAIEDAIDEALEIECRGDGTHSINTLGIVDAVARALAADAQQGGASTCTGGPNGSPVAGCDGGRRPVVGCRCKAALTRPADGAAS